MPNRNVKVGVSSLHGRSLPPLDLLPGFDAAARLLSFSKAADELFVTQSAISRQIRALEEALGVALFARGHRSLSLTAAGHELHEVTRTILQELRQVASRLRPDPDRPSVTVTTVAGFASLWLIPRLAGFADLAPTVDVRISVGHRLADLGRERIDVAIRYGSPEKMGGVVLFEEQFQPVCSPGLAFAAQHPIRQFSDLSRHALLEQGEADGSAQLLDWALWLRSVGAEMVPLRTMTFSQYDSVIAAAVAGQGIALGRLPIINQYLNDGRLVAPFANVEFSTKAYCLVAGPQAQRNPAALQFMEWLIEQARRA